jgi:hypothetical protein
MSGAIKVEVGTGELIDKITILEIKAERITDAAKLSHVRYELSVLSETRDREIPGSEELDRLTIELKTINESLWEIEDDIRACDAAGDFGSRFVDLARAVYRTNDRRAAVKKQINELTGSTVVEEKSYTEFD